MRKVIQITAMPTTTYGQLYALCDDGTIWHLRLHTWQKIEGIPQPETHDPSPRPPHLDAYGFIGERKP